MSEAFVSFDELQGIAAVILFIWSVALVWASWQLHRVAKALDAQERELRRSERLHTLAQRQNVQWQ
jgi:hypothetical protein